MLSVNRNYKRGTVIGLLMAGVFLFTSAEGCDGTDTSADKEGKSRDTSYNSLVAAEPAHSMSYSPTRKTINFWIDTWNKPGKLAYVYLQNANGDVLGYYVLEGPPVSQCTALTPTWQFVGTPDDDSDVKDQRVPAPGVDGAYYSGGECSTYYGKDAGNGAFIEFTAGLGINVLLYDQPLPNDRLGGAKNLSPKAK